MTYITVQSNKGDLIQISPEDSDLSMVKWSIGADGYAVGRYNKRRVKLHRLIGERMLGGPLTSKMLMDHKDGNKLNCQRDNLRVATHQQNARNRKPHKNSRTGYKGLQTNGFSWYAAIRYNGKREYYGPYKTPIEAARVYDQKAIEYFGEFARINNVE